MEYTNIGRSGLKVSRLCLGTMNFGWVTDKSDSFKIMDNALESGINFIDTADCYGKTIQQKNGVGEGLTEEIVGEWLAKGGSRRERIVLATKVYYPMGTEPNDTGLSAYHIKRACEDSLKRLKTDHIDLYQMHHIDRQTPWEEVWQAMEQLVKEGKVTYIGSCNFAAWNIAQAQCIADSRNILGLISEQTVYNLNARLIEMEVIPACKELGLGLLPWSPLGRGILTGVLGKFESGRRSFDKRMRDKIEESRKSLEAYEAFCKKIGEDPAVVALAWLLHQPAVTAPIIGPRTMKQLKSGLASLDIKLSVEDLEALDKIWPGPGNTAPEAYYCRC